MCYCGFNGSYGLINLVQNHYHNQFWPSCLTPLSQNKLNVWHIILKNNFFVLIMFWLEESALVQNLGA